MIDLLRLPGLIPVDIREDGRALVISAEAEVPEVPLCPDCARPMYRHGKRTNSFADTPIEMRPVAIEITRQRFRCHACGKIHLPELSFLDEKRHTTQRLISNIRASCLSRSFHDLSDQTGLAVNTVRNITLDLIEELDKQIMFETPRIMGIDELNIAGGMRCIITNLARNSVYNLLEKRTQEHLKPFFKSMPNKDAIEWVCTDMWRPFKRSFKPFIPNAKLVIDKFHVVKMASEALEHERKKLQKAVDKNERLHLKKSVRWLTLKRPTKLTEEEKYELGLVRQHYPEIALAYDLKEAFYAIYDETDKNAAMSTFEAWSNVIPNNMEAFQSLIKTVLNHYDDIFAYWDASENITNSYTEAMNGVMKVANRIGRGYSFEVIRARILYAKNAREINRTFIAPKPAWQKSMPSNAIGYYTGNLSQQSQKKGRFVEYGPDIKTLAEMAKTGKFD